MNIWIFNHYAQGADMPGGTRHYDLAQELIKKGYQVTLFAAGFHYTLLKETVNYGASCYTIENKNGVRFVWIKTYPYQTNNWKRMINIMSYAIRLNFLIPRLGLEKPDIIIGSTVHPFAPMVAGRFAKKFRTPFIFEIRDLWPQTFIDMGIWKKNSLISKLFKYIEAKTVYNSDKIIVLSPLTIQYLIKEYGYGTDRILLLPNGVNLAFIREVSQNVRDTVCIAYAGGIDKVHGLNFLIDLAESLKDENMIFDIYGDGKEKANLQEACRKLQLENIIWHGSVPKSKLPDKLKDANLLFVSTAEVNYGSENKLYEYMALGKPIISAVSSSHNDPVSDIGCGISLNRNDIEGSSRKLMDFISQYKHRFEFFGEKGQHYVMQNRLVSILADQLEKFIMRGEEYDSNDERR